MKQNNTLLLKLRERKEDLSPTDQTIVSFILANPKISSQSTIRQIAQKAYVSPSSIIRLVKRMGFEGYREFRDQLLLEVALLQHDQQPDKKSNKDLSIEGIIQNLTQQSIRSLEETTYLLDPYQVQKAIQLLIQSRVILLYGIGSSYFVASDAYLKFLRIGKLCLINQDIHAQLVMSKNAHPSDVALIISYSGQTQELLDCIKILKERKTPTIAITRYSENPMSKLVDAPLFISGMEPLLRNGAMSSRIAQLNVIDILFTGLVNHNFEENSKTFIETHIKK